MPETIVKYFDQPMKANCDGNCSKAWGINTRPRVQLSDNIDDYAFLADGELGEAPANPGTAEGRHVKPPNASFFPNNWCIRGCERCNRSNPDEWDKPLPVKSFEKRVYNIPGRHDGDGELQHSAEERTDA